MFVCVYVCTCVFGHKREGIQWEAIDWMDNAECLDLIEKVTDITDGRKADLPPGTMANHQPECVDPGATLLTLTLLSQSIIIESHSACCVHSNVHQSAVWHPGEAKRRGTRCYFITTVIKLVKTEPCWGSRKLWKFSEETTTKKKHHRFLFYCYVISFRWLRYLFLSYQVQMAFFITPKTYNLSNKFCVLCFNLCVAFVCFSFSETGHVGSYQWGESLPQRHRLHPSRKTAQPTRSESTCKGVNTSYAHLCRRP